MQKTETFVCRLLPLDTASGPRNMAADEVMLESAEQGTPSFRVYAWSEATLSLGYFQPEKLRHQDPALSQLPFVRRPSGGGALVHHHELTYALALPADTPWQYQSEKPSAWLTRMHGIIAAALQDFGVFAQLFPGSAKDPIPDILCFDNVAPGDLVIGEAKICGSAQRRHRGTLLQHGAVLCASSTHAPDLPGIKEMTGKNLGLSQLREAIQQQLSLATGWMLHPADWTEMEIARIDDLLYSKYGRDCWNYKR
jgi:lipoate-protein ligase A